MYKLAVIHTLYYFDQEALASLSAETAVSLLNIINTLHDNIQLLPIMLRFLIYADNFSTNVQLCLSGYFCPEGIGVDWQLCPYSSQYRGCIS